MKIGFPNNPRKNLIKEIKWIGENGFDFVDLFLEEDRAVPEKIDIVKVKKLLKKDGLSVIGHTSPYLGIGSQIQSVREICVRELEKYFKIFNKLNIKYVTVHANWPGGLFSDDEGIKFQIETLKELIKRAREYNLKVMYEPINTKYDTLKNVEKILKRVHGLYFHLDVGHANMYGKSVVSFIKKFHKKLVHVHVSDNNGKKDEHKRMGLGNINFERVVKELRRVGYDGTITLEIFSKNKKLVLQSKRKLRRLWNEFK